MRTTPSRRELLGSLPFAALIPVLGGRAQGAAATSPRRLVVLQWTNGVLPGYWPTPPDPSGNFVLTEALSSLERHKQDLVILGGLSIPQWKGSAHFTLPSLLTGAAPKVSPAGYGMGDSISIDQYVARAFTAHDPIPIRSLELGCVYLSNTSLTRSISFRGPSVNNNPLENVPEIDPYRVWRRLFGGRAGRGDESASPPDLARIRDERRSVLDYVAGNLGRMVGGLGKDDRSKLASHLESVRQLEREIYVSASSASGAACSPAPLPANVDVYDNLAVGDALGLQLDLLVLALKCDLTRVATVTMVNCANDSIGFPFLGPEFVGRSDPESDFDHHGIAHRGGPKKAKVDQWWISRFASLLDRLKAVPEGDGTMLDHTMVLFANHMGDGAQHNNTGVPWILAGGKGKFFATGRYLVHAGWNPANPSMGCPPINHALISMSNILLEGLAPSIETFGSAEYTGELPGLR
jgi:hypothetical protein